MLAQPQLFAPPTHLQFALSLGLQPELLPVMAVGTAAGSIFLINPDTMTVYAKLRCAAWSPVLLVSCF